MDEVAREAVLEAMQQNDIRPFESCRADLVIAEVIIPPRKAIKKKKKKRGSGDGEKEEMEGELESKWMVFDNMQDALKAGWEVSSRRVSFRYRCCILERLLIGIRNLSFVFSKNLSQEKVLAFSLRIAKGRS